MFFVEKEVCIELDDMLEAMAKFPDITRKEAVEYANANRWIEREMLFIGDNDGCPNTINGSGKCRAAVQGILKSNECELLMVYIPH